MYEKKERLTFWKHIKENNASGVQCCLSCMSGSPAERALAYRRRKRYMDKMQANYQMMITRQESES
jgi:heterodisulfide reductase subunit C